MLAQGGACPAAVGVKAGRAPLYRERRDGRRQGNQNEDQERAEHPQGDARARNGLGFQDPQGAGPDEGLAPVRAGDEAADRPPGAGELRVPPPVPGAAPAGQARRLRGGVVRPRPGRRPQQQHVPQAAGRVSPVAGAGRRGRRRHHRPEGLGVLPPDQGRHAGLGHPPRRPAACRATGRRDQGDAGRLHRGQRRQGSWRTTTSSTP